MSLNWVDLVILAVFGYYLYSGWQSGFISLLVGFVSLLGSVWVARMWAVPMGLFLVQTFGIPTLWSAIVAYLLLSAAAYVAFSLVLNIFVSLIPYKVTESAVNKIFGLIAGFANALVFVSFVLMVLSVAPLRGTVKIDIASSTLGSRILALAEQYGGPLKQMSDRAAISAGKFFTVTTGSTERMSLSQIPENVVPITDPVGEQRLLELVNTERVKAHVLVLAMDKTLLAIAEKRSLDMFARRYFSHVDPDGYDVSFYIQQSPLQTSWAGENIAYAPDVATAHRGLMNSPGHKRNILSTKYTRVGIGIVDAGIYGKIITQVFTD